MEHGKDQSLLAPTPVHEEISLSMLMTKHAELGKDIALKTLALAMKGEQFASFAKLKCNDCSFTWGDRLPQHQLQKLCVRCKKGYGSQK